MSEITKLYENAGIKPTKNWQSCLNCKLKTETRYDEWGEEYLTCNRLEMPEKCSDAKEYYPIFTAEKQLSLFQWICKKFQEIYISHTDFKEFQSWEIVYKISVHSNSFEECLCAFINLFWQSLTEEEKQQIKEILE